MAFHVGQKVVCVDGSRYGKGLLVPPCGMPIKGHVYTVTEVGMTASGEPGLNVDGCHHPNESGWRQERFRPVVERKTDISIFTAMLNPTSREVEKAR